MELTASYLRGYGLAGETLYHNNSEAENQEIFFYLRARLLNPATGTFISEDTFGGVLSSPITLNRYAYAGQNPVNFVDPSGHFTSLGMCLLTMSADNLANEIRRTISAGLLGALNGLLTAVSDGDTDLTTAIFKGYSFGIAGVGLGYLKELGQAVNSAKLLYVVGQLAMSCYNIYNGLDAISEGDWGTGCILIGLGLLGTVDAACELDAYDFITSGVKGTGYSEPITETVEASGRVEVVL